MWAHNTTTNRPTERITRWDLRLVFRTTGSTFTLATGLDPALRQYDWTPPTPNKELSDMQRGYGLGLTSKLGLRVILEPFSDLEPGKIPNAKSNIVGLA